MWPRLIAATGATLFAAVPGLCRQLIKYARPGLARLPSLRHGLIAGETPPPDLFEAWRDASATDLHEALGMSEISTYVSSSPSVPRRPGTVGKPQPGRRVAILDQQGGADPLPPGAEGLLAVHRSDPGLMLGYWNRPAEEAEVFRGDWFTGGDLAVMDDCGYVTHLGRANDLMNAMGYRVSPQEVEAALLAHPSVAEAACAEITVTRGRPRHRRIRRAARRRRLPARCARGLRGRRASPPTKSRAKSALFRRFRVHPTASCSGSGWRP